MSEEKQYFTREDLESGRFVVDYEIDEDGNTRFVGARLLPEDRPVSLLEMGGPKGG